MATFVSTLLEGLFVRKCQNNIGFRTLQKDYRAGETLLLNGRYNKNPNDLRKTVVWLDMEFCDGCGSRMTRTKDGYVCPKCGNTIRVKPAMELEKKRATDQSNFIYVSKNEETGYVRIFRECPKCGNKEAFQWFSGVSGEHAGVARERAVEHLRCTKCSHTWAEGA